jgi:hypothetical protein
VLHFHRAFAQNVHDWGAEVAETVKIVFHNHARQEIVRGIQAKVSVTSTLGLSNWFFNPVTDWIGLWPLSCWIVLRNSCRNLFAQVF